LKKRIEKTCGARIPDYLVLTHTHFDHAANAAFLKKTFGLKIVVHQSEAGFLKEGNTPLPDIVGGPLKWINRFDRRKISFIARVEPAEADIIISEELDLSEKNIPVKLLPLPGHSNGSLTVFVDDEIAIVGDNMVNLPWQRILPPFADNLPALFESWKKLLDTPCRIFLPSHGSEISRAMLEAACLRQPDIG
jgi:glyoxylase-like metal-dependent hydrolase (beta-lactamase superfamily II)